MKVPKGTKVATVAVTSVDLVFVRNGGEDPQPLGRINYAIIDIEPSDVINGTFKFVFAAFLDAAMPQKWIGGFHLRILCF